MFDIRLALRVMRRQPGFTLVSVTLIALAIAATTSIFSVVNSVVLEPLPSVKMDGLVRVFEYDARRARTMPVLSNSTYYAWHDTPETIEGLAAWDDWPLSSEGPSGFELVRGADVRQSGADAAVQPEIFASRSQFLSAMPATQYVVARTIGDPAALASDLRAIVTSASSRGVVEEVMTMDTRLMTSLARPRLYAVLLGGFAVFALLIAMIGLFGGLSYVVAQRTREFGVRTALGATPRDIMALVMRQGTILTASGLVAGFGIAAGTVRYLAQFLFGVAPLDPATFVVTGAVLTVTALAACAIPARRAARIDAIEALRR